MHQQKYPLYKYFVALILILLPLFSQAQDCADVVIPSLPYQVSSTTCGVGSDIDIDDACSSWDMSGEDLTYSFTTADQLCLRIELSNFGTSAGVIVTDGCPGDADSECISSLTDNLDTTPISATISVLPNTTYYITISSDQFDTPCIDFDLSIDSDCPEPNSNDCLGAINICEGYFYEENAPTGNGNYIDDLPTNGCVMSAVENMGWYQLTTQTAGNLSFTLTPNAGDDYDWMLFDITDASCAELASNPDLVVSCNTFGEIGNNGETGISSASGGTGSANGPGNTNGPPFNADLNVEAGRTYVLMISNWSGTPNGYELDFGASTAGFYDDIPPEVESVTGSCSGVDVQFSEYMDCTTALPEYFTVEGPGGPYTVVDLESNCQNGLTYAENFVLSLDNPFPPDGGDFQIVFGQDELADLCGNFLEPVTVPFTVPAGMELDASSTPASCDTENGTITITVTSGGLAPFNYSLDGEDFQNESAFTHLPAGDYTVTVKDDVGCENEIDVTIENDAVLFTAGEDTYACQLSFTGNATTPAGYTGLWTAPAGVQMSDAANPHCVFTPSAAGTYQFTWAVSNDMNCTLEKSVEVVFNAIEVINFSTVVPTCHNKCNGSAEVVVSGVADMGALEYIWSGGNSSSATPETATQLCPGSNLLTLKTGEGCTLDYSFDMENPSPLALDSVFVQPESCPGFCDGKIVIVQSEATEYSFNSGENFSPDANANNLCAGTYRLVLKNEANCELDTTIQLQRPRGPVAKFYSSPHRQSTFTPVFQFDNLSEDYISSYWQFDYPDGADFSRKENPEYKYPNAQVGDYTVMLVVADEKGCRDTTFQKVGIYEDTWIYIPNSFTPNGDGLNDIFKPVVSNVDVEDYNLRVFDRWGQKVFDTDDINQGWNGSVSGSDYFAQAGNYVYRIHIRESESGEAREWNGIVTVVR